VQPSRRITLLNKLKQLLVPKRRGKLLKGIFPQDTAACHKAAITHQKLADLHFDVLKHPAYSPGLLQTTTFFPNLKKHFKGRMFLSNEETTLAVDGWLHNQKNFS
jgi:hypothetical protein